VENIWFKNQSVNPAKRLYPDTDTARRLPLSLSGAIIITETKPVASKKVKRQLLYCHLRKRQQKLSAALTRRNHLLRHSFQGSAGFLLNETNPVGNVDNLPSAVVNSGQVPNYPLTRQAFML